MTEIIMSSKNQKNSLEGSFAPPNNNVELALSHFILNGIKEKFIAYNKTNNVKSDILKTNCKVDRPNDFLKYVIDSGGRDFLAIEFNLKDTRIAMIDFDGEHHSLEWIHENYPFLKDHKPFPGNTKGHHFFIDNEVNLNLKKSINLDDKKIDYITDLVWIPPNQYKDYKNYKPKYLHENHIKLISESILENKMDSLIDKLPVELNQKILNYNNEEVAELLDILDLKRSEEYKSWSCIIAALKSQDLYDLAHKFSSRCFEKHSDIEFDKQYKSAKNYSIGIIYNYAKQDNRDKYFQIIRKYKFKHLDFIIDDFESTDRIAKKIAPFLEDNLKYCNKKWYVCRDNIWECQENCYDSIIDTLSSGILNSKRKILEEIEKNLNNKEKVKFLEQQEQKLISKRNQYDNKAKLSLVENYLQSMLKEENFHQKLDSTSYKIAFQNGIYDLYNFTFIECITPGDYISKTLPFNFDKDEIQEEVCDKIQEDLDKLFTSDEERDYVLTFIAYAMLGIPEKEQVFRYHYGRAGNGKSQLLNNLAEVFPIYFAKVDSNLFKKNHGKKHKFLEHFQNNRICYTEEVPEGPLDPEVIKEICDGNFMNAELLYGTSIQYKINSKLIMNSNNLLNADRIDGGLERRLEIVKFKNRFVDSQDKIENALKSGAANAYLIDPEMKSRWIDNPMCVFALICTYAARYNDQGLGKAPKDFIEAKEMIIETNNQFESWLFDSIEISEDYCESKTNIINKYKADTGQIINEKSLKNVMKDFPYKYDRDKQKNKIKGCYLGFQFKQEEVSEEQFINTQDDLDI